MTQTPADKPPTLSLNLPVVCNMESALIYAEQLAQDLQQPLFFNADPVQITDTDFVLLYDEHGLCLQQTGRKAPGPIRAEFAQGAVDHRRKFGGGKGQMIAKAVGLKAGVYPRVLDATAGLGKDAFVLASLGCNVQMVERSPIVHALLQNGLMRALSWSTTNDHELSRIMERMNLIADDGRHFMLELTEVDRPDVIYLDPMFPEREKSADVKKDMRAFHSLVGTDNDAAELIELALVKALYRVVVKRPRKAPTVSSHKPSFQIEGKSSRYDIYALKKLPDHLPSLEPNV